MGGYSFFDKAVDFLVELFKSLTEGYLFFGSTADVVRAVFDIVLIAALCYLALRFVKQSRAWQLIQGLIFIYAVVLVCSLFGLQMVGFLFSKLLYVFAILMVVIFQPELRRGLETVGLKSFTSLRKSLSPSASDEKKDEFRGVIHEICDACKEMSKTYTGALILLERNTKLDELLTQENAVRFESSVTSSVLQSLFYKGAPMHDGGVLIRDSKIIAARCHVPLSVTMHMLERTGTRHRAAVGASEMGDTVAIAVSEERGKSSIAVNGRLFEMKDANELEANLLYLFGLSVDGTPVSGIKKALRGIRKKNDSKVVTSKKKAVSIKVSEVESGDYDASSVSKKVESKTERKEHNKKVTENIAFIVISVLISFGLWVYIQINTNPVVTKTIVVPISYTEDQIPEGVDVFCPFDTVKVEIVGRSSVLSNLDTSDVVASIDFSEVTSAGVTELPINVTSADSDVYFRVNQQLPETVSVTVYSINN